MTIYAPRGQAFSFDVPLILLDDTDFADIGDYAPAGADFQIVKDGGAEAELATTVVESDLAAHSIGYYTIAVTAAEMQAERISIYCVDAALEHNSWLIETVSGDEMWASEITSVTDNGQFIIDEGSAVADVFNGCGVMVVDQATQSSRSFGVVANYIVTTREIFLVDNFLDPATIAANDRIFIYRPVLQASVMGAVQVVQTGDSFARLGAPAGASVSADLLVIDNFVDGIESDLANGTDGLGALKTLIDTVNSDLANGTDGLGALKTLIDGLLDPSLAAIADAVWDEVLTGATHNVVNSAGRRLRQVEAAFVVATGTAQAGTASTITLAAGESATSEIFQGDRIIIVEGTGVGEHGIIIAYDGSTKIATMSQNWVITPDATSVYDITPADVDVETWQHTVVTVSATTALPEVDAKSISDNAAAADNVQANIGNLDEQVSVVDAVADLILTDTTAIVADTGTDGVVLASATKNSIADHVINRDLANANGSDGDTKSFRSLFGAIAKLVNKVTISGGVLTVTEEDDTTSLGTQNVTTDAAADPITGVDTV